jgi:hypothetical protein
MEPLRFTITVYEETHPRGSGGDANPHGPTVDPARNRKNLTSRGPQFAFAGAAIIDGSGMDRASEPVSRDGLQSHSRSALSSPELNNIKLPVGRNLQSKLEAVIL